MSSPHVQHALNEGEEQVAAAPLPQGSLATRIAWISVAIGSVCLMLGVGIALDAKSEAESRVTEARSQASLERLREDRLWLHRMANAYAHGHQQGAVDSQDPQVQRLVQACQLIAGEQP